MKWTAPERDGGSPITNYIIEKRDVKRKGWQVVDTTVKELKYTASPLNEGSLYVFRVAAENAVGPSEYCELADSVLAKDTFGAYLSFTITCFLLEWGYSLINIFMLIFHLTGTPGPPYNLTVTEVSKSHVDLKWDAPQKDGGRPVLR